MMEIATDSIRVIAEKLQLSEVLVRSSNEQKFEVLSGYLDGLIVSDFNKLLSILYRIDVQEEKVKKALVENKDKISAGMVIAKLLIERETEKIKLRAKYR
jgi:hypothetical protein